jgi:hypothetical protein
MLTLTHRTDSFNIQIVQSLFIKRVNTRHIRILFDH